MRRARRAAIVLFGCALLAACGATGGAGGAASAPEETLRNQLPAREPSPPVIPGVPAVAAPAPPIALPPLGMDIVLDMSEGGDVVLGGRLVRDAELDGVLMRLHAADPQRQLIIRADGRIGHLAVVALMQRAKAAGFTRLAVPGVPLLWRRLQLRERSPLAP